jgi:hypothetical protein
MNDVSYTTPPSAFVTHGCRVNSQDPRVRSVVGDSSRARRAYGRHGPLGRGAVRPCRRSGSTRRSAALSPGIPRAAVLGVPIGAVRTMPARSVRCLPGIAMIMPERTVDAWTATYITGRRWRARLRATTERAPDERYDLGTGLGNVGGMPGHIDPEPWAGRACRAGWPAADRVVGRLAGVAEHDRQRVGGGARGAYPVDGERVGFGWRIEHARCPTNSAFRGRYSWWRPTAN